MGINTVKQIAPLVNDIFKEITGQEGLVNEDLSNLVDVGKTIENLNKGVDNYTEKLLHKVGKMQFVDRPYTGVAPKIYKDAWEYGAVRSKIRMEPPEAGNEPAWALQAGQSYDDNIFNPPIVNEKFYDKATDYQMRMSYAYDRAKGSLTGAEAMTRFVSMIDTMITNTRTAQMDALIMRVINNMTAATMKKAYGATAFNAASKVQAVNLLYEYNTKFTPATTLTAENCLYDKEFLRYAAFRIFNYTGYLKNYSTLFNSEGAFNHTPADKQHTVILSLFEHAAEYYLDSVTYHETIVKLPRHETVDYWQGSGNAFDLADAGKIKLKPETAAGDIDEVEQGGILAVIFDDDACGVTNELDTIRTHINASGDFYNSFFKYKASYFNSFDENFVVFFVA